MTEKTTKIQEQSKIVVVESSFKRKLLNLLKTLQSPILAILGAVLVGAIIILITGRDPVSAYLEMFKGAFLGKNFSNFASTLNRAVPIIGLGVAASITFKAGLANIGVEGQMLLGAMTAALISIYLPLPGAVLLPISLLGAMIVGGLYALLALTLELKLKIPLIITTLILNYPAHYFTTYLVTFPFQDVASAMVQTKMVPESVRFAPLGSGSQLNTGSFTIVIIFLVTSFVMYHTVRGYNLRMVGLNRRFAIYGGVKTKKILYSSMFISGALAGFVGAIMVFGVFYRFIDGALTTPMYAWLGIMTAILADANPLGVTLAGMVFSAIQTGGYGMERNTDTPRELSQIIQSLIIMFIAVRNSLQIKRKG